MQEIRLQTYNWHYFIFHWIVSNFYFRAFRPRCESEGTNKSPDWVYNSVIRKKQRKLWSIHLINHHLFSCYGIYILFKEEISFNKRQSLTYISILIWNQPRTKSCCLGSVHKNVGQVAKIEWCLIKNQYKLASRRLLKDSDRQLCNPHPS